MIQSRNKKRIHWKHVFAVCLLFFVLSDGFAQAGQKGRPLPLGSKTKTAFYYTFTGAASQTEVDSLTQQFLNLSGVSECKIRFKPESKLTEVLFIVTIREAVKESDKQLAFDGTGFKKIMETHNYAIFSEFITKVYSGNGSD